MLYEKISDNPNDDEKRVARADRCVGDWLRHTYRGSRYITYGCAANRCPHCGETYYAAYTSVGG